MESKEFQELNGKLIEAGVLNIAGIAIKGILFNLENPVSMLVNTKTSALPFENIFLEYAPKLKDNELEIVIRCISEKGFSKSASFLISLFKESKMDISTHILWAAGNALSIINDKNTYDEIIKICQNKKFGSSRQMLISLLPRIKTDEAYNTLLKCLKDKEIRGHVIQALGKFGRVEAIEILEKLEVEKGKYEYKAKINALKKLKKNRS